MESLTSKRSRWLRKTTAAGMIPFLLEKGTVTFSTVYQSFWAESRRGATAVGRRESLLPAAFAIMPVPQSPP